jgi:hypothetical protein
MRMWNVDPKFMCNKHLLGEHLEMHMFAGSIEKGKNIKGFIDKGLVDIAGIMPRHQELIIEMESRGMKHKSPLIFSIYSDKAYDTIMHYGTGKVDSSESARILFSRCSDCLRRLRDDI